MCEAGIPVVLTFNFCDHLQLFMDTWTIGRNYMNIVAHRRQYPRYAAVFSTKYRIKEGFYRDLTRDVGAGGLFITTNRTVEQGRRINIQIPIFAFERRLSLMGTIVRCEPEGFAVMFEEALEVEIFRDGRFPANIRESKRSTTRIDKDNVF